MRRPLEIVQEVQAMATVGQLAGAFEGVASMHIAKIKDQVIQSQEFFEELWQIYTQLRVDKEFHSGRGNVKRAVINKELIIVITSDGSLSGDIDQKLIDDMLSYYNKKFNDIVVIGFHGAHQLKQIGVTFQKEYKLPDNDQKIDFSLIVAEIQKYRTCRVYYQTYVSLARQEVKNIELNKSVEEQGEATQRQGDYISPSTYILEPSVFTVVDHMERSMLQIAIAQVVLESKLAQYASRFSAMSMAHRKANDASSELNRELSHAKRALKDERTKEIINGLRKERALI